jgi:hypothetical protein
MAINEIGDGIKDRIASWHLRRKFFWLLAIIVLGFALYSAFILYYPYSEGTRTGLLRKLSHKGYVFKTWEGELQMSAVLTPTDANGTVAGGNVWAFSVKEDAAIKGLQEAERTGKRVTLHYVEYTKQLFWRGETKYFVDGVTLIQD